MLKLSKILVIIELDNESHPALDKAIRLAEHSNADLELLSTEYTPYFSDGQYFDPIQASQIRQQYLDDHLQRLEVIAQPIRATGRTVNVATAWGNPAYEQINQHIAETNPSLVVKSTRYHNKLARFFLANEDWELIRHCPIPLLLVKNLPWTESPVFIAAVDPDHANDKPASLDDKLIRSAIEISAVCDGVVHLFHEDWIPPLAGIYPPLADPSEATEKLEKLGKKHGIGVEFCHWTDDSIEVSLPELASELSASVVVMGAVSRSKFDRVLIGSTAERVLDHLHCDVLIIKPD